jgi:quinol monooxygenase YgiN
VREGGTLSAMTVLVHARLHGLAGQVPALRDVLSDHAAAVARAAGSHGAEVYQRLDAEHGEFVVQTWWSDEAAMRTHYTGAEYAAYSRRVSDLLARPSDVDIHYIGRTVRPQADLSQDPARQD